MEIKTPLKKLIALFAQSASTEELTMPVRQFAAQLTILTAHVDRVEAKLEAKAKVLDTHIAELAALIMAAQSPKAASSAPAATPSTPPSPSASAEEAQQIADAAAIEGLSEEEATEAMLAKAREDMEADLADAAKAQVPPPAKPSAIALRKVNGGKKATNAGDAA